ncbi:hypothetical protein MKY84_03680 [Chryseomicrobium sp. FSL W7-1435]|uniref:hypothetical protein n=1 Tax=Chryseomicrobium sp. FSL W7-1435 TaxID=2921704 RepID=UPI00315A5DD7
MDFQTLFLIALIGFTFYLNAEVRSLRARIRRLEKAASPTPSSFSPEFEQELDVLLQQGKMVEAVKRVREEHGFSLLEAKQAVDRHYEK